VALLAFGALAAAVAVGLADAAETTAGATPGGQPIVEGVRWPDVSLPVAVDLGELPPEWQALARRALATWNSAGSSFWYFEAAGGDVGLNAVRFQVVERLMVCGGQWQPAACTYPYIYQFAPQHLSHAFIQLDRERLRAERPRRPLDVIDLPALLTHELGHALGLGEAASPTAAMFPGALWSALGADDLRELRALYGVANGPRPEQPPTPRQPPDGGAAPPRPTLRWEPVPAAFGYYLQVAPAAVHQGRGGFVDVGLGEYAIDTTTEGPEYQAPAALAEGAEYYWRVKARTPGGNSLWSAPARFVARAAAP
jgi:hypothetical protein